MAPDEKPAGASVKAIRGGLGVWLGPITASLGLGMAGLLFAEDAIDIGSRRELFLDDALIEGLGHGAQLRLHAPVPREVAIVFDAPWEGSGSGSNNLVLFQDGDLYRMYYQALRFDPFNQPYDGLQRADGWRAQCYAESDDGIHWRKPMLGLFEFEGSKANNIVIPNGVFGGVKINASPVAVFKDENPAAKPEAKYKAIVVSREMISVPTNSTPPRSRSRSKGLLAFQSPDGLHWSPLSRELVVTDGYFDALNLAFWDAVRGEYRIYWRYYSDPVAGEPRGYRSIRTATSKDFLHWENQRDLHYGNSPPQHLYTSQIKPYHRAPHILIGFPARYVDRGWSESMRALPDPEHRKWRADANQRLGTAVTESLIMASRDRVTFKLWSEAFLRPGIERTGTWDYGGQYLGWHVVETKSSLPGAPNELSLYACEGSMIGRTAEGAGPAERRYTLRLDGFVSLNAPMTGGELTTKVIRFSGKRLLINFSTSAKGDVRVEFQTPSGDPIPGFTLADCPPIFGDSIEREVNWPGADLGALAGRPLRIRFVVRDADLFAYQFQE